MCLKNVLGLVTLHVGVIVLAVFYFTQAFFISAVNVFDYIHDRNGVPLAPMLAGLAVFLIILIGTSLSVGAYYRSRKFIQSAIVLIITLTMYYATLTTISFTIDIRNVHYLCIGNRCPETLWLWSWYNLPEEEYWENEVFFNTHGTDKIPVEQTTTPETINIPTATALVTFHKIETTSLETPTAPGTPTSKRIETTSLETTTAPVTLKKIETTSLETTTAPGTPTSKRIKTTYFETSTAPGTPTSKNMGTRSIPVTVPKNPSTKIKF